MAMDLKEFQKRLNSDPGLRSRFLENPVKTIEAEGCVLPDGAKKALAAFVDLLPKPKEKAEYSEIHIKVIV